MRDALRASLIDYAAAQPARGAFAEANDVQERIVAIARTGIAGGRGLDFRVFAGANRAWQKPARSRRRAPATLADARVRVADAIGVSVKALEGAELRFDLFARPSTATELMSAAARDEALRHRADILGALADYAASQSALQLEIAKQYPDVHLGPGYQYDQGDNKCTLGAHAELPVLNQNQGPIAEAAARREEAAAQFNAVQAKVLAEIERAVAAFQVSEENLATLQSLAAAQAKQREAVEAQVRGGGDGPAWICRMRSWKRPPRIWSSSTAR